MNPTIKQMLNSVCVWIDSTAMSQMIQTTPWIVPAVQTVHILAIAALMGAMLMINLRLVGMAGRDQSIAQVSRRFSKVIWWALPVLLITGAVLITGEPARALKNNIFQLKMLLVMGAMVVTFWFARPLNRNPAHWDSRTGTGRLLALISVSLWVGIIFAGRWIAYF
jgi:putative copper export protein